MSILMPEQINRELVGLPQWRQSNNVITRDFPLNNFAKALRLIAEIGAIAETADHHPDLLLHDYRFVQVTLTTHSAGGLTLKDFALARKIEALFHLLAQA